MVRSGIPGQPRYPSRERQAVLIGDGIKVAKAGRKMPGVKKLHQQSESNTKPECIFGHSAYYPATPPPLSAPRRRGRPKRYGNKIKVASLLDNKDGFEEAASPVYGEENVTIRFKVADLLWRPPMGMVPVGILVRFVAVDHPRRGTILLTSTDLTLAPLAPLEIIRIYGLRFEIEVSFKQSLRVIGAYAYHFWMAAMTPLRRASGLQILSATTSKLIWRSYGSWIRTIRSGLAPSEQVTAIALRNTLPEFLAGSAKTTTFTKFLRDRIDLSRTEGTRLAA